MMNLPLGDFLRRIVNPKSWLGVILSLTRGIGIKVGDNTILLDRKDGVGNTLPGQTKLDSKPHQPGPLR
jgi:hypothetical protein